MSIEDARQDAALAALRVQHNYDPIKTPGVSFEAWLFRRVLGILQDQYGTLHRRAAKRFPPDAGDPVAYEARTRSHVADGNTCPNLTTQVDENFAERLDTKMDLADAISKLPERQQKVVTALLIEGRSQLDVAGDLDLSQATVSKLFNAAKAKLRELLGEAYA